jgi:D-alanyl-D-alanine carboxypeptidase/D-alanyl-D-alanine-endopeptidase (penicillin-binding protein 4)
VKKALILIFICTNAYSQISSKKIDRWVSKNENLKNSVVSIAIKELNKNKKIRGININTFMTPASNLKILSVLGSIYVGDTIPVIKYNFSNDTLRISPTGYPLLSHPKYQNKQLEKFVNSFNHIEYNLPNTELIKYGPAWAWDDLSYYFQAERSSMPIFGNVVQIIKKENGDLILTPNNFKINLDYNQKEKINRALDENIFTVNPSLIKLGDTIYHPFISSNKVIVNLLRNSLKTSVSLSNNKLDYYQVLNIDDVDEIYSIILKKSDNLISESLVANISFRINDTISVNKGLDIIENSFKKSISNQMELFDGSGLSRYNLITPEALVNSLERIYSSIGLERVKRIFPNNFIIEDNEDFVWGKSGTLKNNYNYSGYIITNKGKQYVFSIMINHFTEDLDKIKSAIVDFLIFLKTS